MVLICISLIIRDTENFFMYLLAICMSSLGKYLFRSSAYFLFGFGFIWVLLLSCMSYSYIWGIDPLSHTRFANIFPHFSGYLFIFFYSFAVQKLFYFDVVPLVYVCFCCLCQKSVVKNKVKELSICFLLFLL